MEKHDGTFVLSLRPSHNLWDSAEGPSSRSPPRRSVTVNFAQTYSEIDVYDPLVGAAPVATYSNQSQVTVGLTDHPLLVEVKTGSATMQRGTVTNSGAGGTVADAAFIGSAGTAGGTGSATAAAVSNSEVVMGGPGKNAFTVVNGQHAALTLADFQVGIDTIKLSGFRSNEASYALGGAQTQRQFHHPASLGQYDDRAGEHQHPTASIFS